MFEQLTDDARRVVAYAQEESRLLRHAAIGTEHLLLGLLHDDTPTRAALSAVGITLASAREYVGQLHPRGTTGQRGQVPFTARAGLVIEDSSTHAARLGQTRVAGSHLLYSLLAVRDATAARALRLGGVDLDALALRAREIALADG